MPDTSRRAFLGQLGAAAVTIPGLGAFAVRSGFGASAAAAPQQASGTSTMYDLLIAGGRVIDPSQRLSAERDVAILHGKIARVDANIPPNQARQVYDAKGKLVTPGLIDLHTHVYEYGQTLGVNPERVGVQSGVTTVLDCGSVGVPMWAGFRKFIIQGATTKIYALLNISTAGCCLDEVYLDPRLIDAKGARRIIEQNRDIILGVKVRIRGKRDDVPHDVEVMKVARDVADATGTIVMSHWTDAPEVLNVLKKGDVLTHRFNPPSPNTANMFGFGAEQSDKVLSEILALKERGIWTDAQAGTTHTQWEVVEKAVRQGWFPDTLSTDVARNADSTPASVLAPMTALLHFGMTLDQVIERVTANPAKILNLPDKIGTLQPGVNADVAVLELVQGKFELRDGRGQIRAATQQFVDVATVKSGIFVKGAPQAT
jgi:dihydroorotase